MTALLAAYRGLYAVNTFFLRIGRTLSWIALALMVFVILLQVVYRYVPFLDALNWPEEAARFLMLWLTGLCAPSALRWGGFVAIDMVPRALAGRASTLLLLALHLVAMMVLVMGVYLGWNHVDKGWLFASSSLRIPLDLIGLDTIKVKLAWMYMSLLVGFILMLSVAVELLLKLVMQLVDPTEEFPDDPDMIFASGD